MTALCASRAPTNSVITDYDRTHAVLYFRLFDAAEADATWQEVTREVLGIDPEQPDAHAIWKSHLARARWMVEHGWQQLARSG